MLERLLDLLPAPRPRPMPRLKPPVVGDVAADDADCGLGAGTKILLARAARRRAMSLAANMARVCGCEMEMSKLHRTTMAHDAPLVFASPRPLPRSRAGMRPPTRGRRRHPLRRTFPRQGPHGAARHSLAPGRGPTPWPYPSTWTSGTPDPRVYCGGRRTRSDPHSTRSGARQRAGRSVGSQPRRMMWPRPGSLAGRALLIPPLPRPRSTQAA